VADTAVLLVLFCLALNAKEIAFFLPFAAIAQVALLGPAGTLRARVQAGRVYVLPVAYAVIYITIYMLRLTAPLRSHVLGGVLLSNARFYFLALMGRQASSVLISALALAVLAAATGFALLPLRGEARPVARGGARVLAYLAVIFAANIGLVAGAQFPDDFYLLIAEWAFLSLAAASFVLLQGAVRVVRLSGLAALGVLLVVFLHKRAGDLFVWGNGEVLREAHVLAADYAQLRPYCGAPMAQGMKFVMPTRPLGFFYFFRGGNDGPDQLLPMFICERPVAAAMAYSYDGNATPDRPDELIVTFTRDFSVASVSQK
jgi:hypothetical protein